MIIPIDAVPLESVTAVVILTLGPLLLLIVDGDTDDDDDKDGIAERTGLSACSNTNWIFSCHPLC